MLGNLLLTCTKHAIIGHEHERKWYQVHIKCKELTLKPQGTQGPYLAVQKRCLLIKVRAHLRFIFIYWLFESQVISLYLDDALACSTEIRRFGSCIRDINGWRIMNRTKRFPTY